MTMVTLAGSRGVWASFSKRTVPVSPLHQHGGGPPPQGLGGRGQEQQGAEQGQQSFHGGSPFSGSAAEAAG